MGRRMVDDEAMESWPIGGLYDPGLHLPARAIAHAGLAQRNPTWNVDRPGGWMSGPLLFFMG